MSLDHYLSTLFPPTVNNYYGKARGSGIFLSSKGRAFRAQLGSDAFEQNVYGLRLDYKLQVDVILYPPDRRTRDLDNYMKALLDACTHALIWEDDSLIDCLVVHRGKQVRSGKVVLRIREHSGFILPDDMDIWDSIE